MEFTRKLLGRKKAKKLMPETWILNNNNHIDLFNKSYKSDNIYILKKYSKKKWLIINYRLSTTC